MVYKINLPHKMKRIQSIKKRYYTIILLLFAIVGCSNKDIISKEDMAKIVADMFVVDQLSEQKPDIRIASDSLKVYETIIEHYGYTYEQFQQSTKYYIQKGDQYKKIHIGAKDIIQAKTSIYRDLANRERELEKWKWIMDTIKYMPPNRLTKEPFFRSIKWLVTQNQYPTFIFTEAPCFDNPANSEWWITNITRPYNKFPFPQKNTISNKERFMQIDKSRKLLSSAPPKVRTKNYSLNLDPEEKAELKEENTELVK